MYPEYFFFKESKENPRSRSLYFGTKGKELKLMEENIVVQRSSVHWRSSKNRNRISKVQSHCIEQTISVHSQKFFKTIFFREIKRIIEYLFIC